MESLERVDRASLSNAFMLSLFLQPSYLAAPDILVDPSGQVFWTDCGSLFSPLYQRDASGHHILQSRNALFCLKELMDSPISESTAQRVSLMDLPTILLEWLADLRVLSGEIFDFSQRIIYIYIYVCVCVCLAAPLCVVYIYLC